jgi:hypothetical protein
MPIGERGIDGLKKLRPMVRAGVREGQRRLGLAKIIPLVRRGIGTHLGLQQLYIPLELLPYLLQVTVGAGHPPPSPEVDLIVKLSNAGILEPIV